MTAPVMWPPVQRLRRLLYVIFPSVITLLILMVLQPDHNGDSNQGYWGEKTANTNWCESDYVVTEYVAEFFNSLSSWFIVGNGVFGCIAHRQFIEPKFLLCFVLLCVVGVGSCAFHATLWSSMQSLDELPMVWLNSAFFYTLATIEEPRKARGGSPLLPDRPTAALGLFLFTVCETAAILIFDTTDQVVFLLCYGGGVAVLIPLTARFNARFNPDGRANLMELSLVICASCHIPLHTVTPSRRYTATHLHIPPHTATHRHTPPLTVAVGLLPPLWTVMCMLPSATDLSGFCVWLIDRRFCASVRSLHLHSLWHFCAGLGTFTAILKWMWLRHTWLRDDPRIVGALPLQRLTIRLQP